MDELTLEEVQEVNGGWYQYVVGWAIGHALDYSINSYVNYWSSAVDNGWGQNQGSHTLQPYGFGTI